MPRQTSLLDTVWIPVRDANPTGLDIFQQHYSARAGRKTSHLAGPGESCVLVTPDALALFVWRAERYRQDDQTGINCSVFRNEGAGLSSDLIRAAELIAWERWPGERLYTFVDPKRTRHKRDPGRCFLKAGWKHAGWTKGGLRILEKLPEWGRIHPSEVPDLNQTPWSAEMCRFARFRVVRPQDVVIGGFSRPGRPATT